jgi:hypothetical protein
MTFDSDILISELPGMPYFLGKCVSHIGQIYKPGYDPVQEIGSAFGALGFHKRLEHEYKIPSEFNLSKVSDAPAERVVYGALAASDLRKYLNSVFAEVTDPFSTIQLMRYRFGPNHTLGRLQIGDFECETLEDTARPDGIKVFGETCIPIGLYRVERSRSLTTLDRNLGETFPDIHKGTLYIRDVPGFSGIAIHPGNWVRNTLGCILPGEFCTISNGEAMVHESRAAYRGLYKSFHSAGMLIRIYCQEQD